MFTHYMQTQVPNSRTVLWVENKTICVMEKQTKTHKN